VLVRSKSHAQDIIRLLKQSDIAVEAIEMERLAQRPMIKNLRNLTRVLINPADNLAWTGLLRSEFCGLTLKSIHQLLSINSYFPKAIETLLEQSDKFVEFTEVARLQYFYAGLAPFIDNTSDKPLAFCVRAAWFALGGPQLNSSSRDLRDADQFFSALQEQISDSPVARVDKLDEIIEQLFSAPETAGEAQAVKVMTLHKSKGLEFDHVFIPHLEKMPRNEQSQLILWQELSNELSDEHLNSINSDNRGRFLVAPMKLGDASADRIYRMLDDINKEKQQYENGRLLYVGATRAKKRLYLLAESSVGIKDDDYYVKPPNKGSLLYQLWPVVEAEVNAQLTTYKDDKGDADVQGQPMIQLTRMDIAQPVSHFEPRLTFHLREQTLSSESDHAEVDWENSTLATVGTLIHEYLQVIAEQGLDNWSEADVAALTPTLTQCLRQSAVCDAELSSSVALIIEAITKTINDRQGRWLLSNHKAAESELSLSVRLNERFATFVIDRTFIDEKGTRWIIDYKTSYHSGNELERFFTQEMAKYQAQLQQYARIMAQKEANPVRCALYLPMHQRLLEYPENFHL
jgi:ATP-dependent exoDNAse (exonuclease V) beta subunit